MQPPRYSVQLLLPREVWVEPALLHARLVGWRADVARFGGANHIGFAIPTDDLPLLAYIFQAPLEAYAEPLCDALTWTPAWHERWDDIAARCRSSIVVAITAQRPINHASILLAFLAVLDAVLAELAPADRDRAILHWIPARQLLTFERYRELRTDLGPCGPAVNVRITNATGRPGELMADTVGMSELGLPDLQTVFSNRDPAVIALRLRGLVRRMFVGDRLDCAWSEEASLFPPMRDALTLRLDDSFR